MPEGANSELVRAVLLAMNRGDDDAFRAALHDDVDWDAGSNAFGLPERLYTADDVVRAAADARERAGRFTAILHEVRERGDDVLVIGVLAGNVTMPRAWIWTIRDGKAARVRAFGSRSSALEAWERGA